MRTVLDALYRASGVLSVLSLVSIAVLTLAQIAARLAGTIVPSADDFATFAMAASIFFGLTYAYRMGDHVRVLAVRNRVAPAVRRAMEVACLAAAAAMLGYVLVYTFDMIVSTYRLKEHTLGLIPIPTWIPMVSMLIGMGVFFLAVLDDLVVVLGNGKPSYADAEAEHALPAATAE